MQQLKFIVPKTGHEFTADFMDRFPVVLNAEEAVLGIAELFTEAELIAGLGVVFPLVSAVIGQWFTLGSGYAAAREEIASKNMKSGFATGAVIGADGTKAETMRDLFWKFSPDSNPFDQEAGKIAQQCYNQGLVAGFMQGRALDQEQRAWLWRQLGHQLGDQSWRGKPSDWERRDWVDWYITAEVAFQKFLLA